MNKQCGFGIVEIIIGVTIISVSLAAASLVAVNAERARVQYIGDIQASYLLEEGIEAVRIMRDERWSNLATLTLDSPYSLVWSGTTWATSSDPAQFIDGVFERTFSVSSVSRDASDDIVSSGGTLDEGTRLVTVSVSWWRGAATTTRTISTYLANLFPE